jgi:cellulose biosynthesis protein BcsQ
MLTVALQNSKGGVGKTTTAKELAYFLTTKGYRTIILDSDVNASLLDFSVARYQSYGDSVVPIDVEHYTGDSLDSKLELYKAKGYDACIIDTHGDYTDIEQQIVELVDMIILPVQPETSTNRATVKLLNHLEKQVVARNDGYPILALLFVAYDKREVVAKECIKELQQRDIMDFDTHLTNYGAKYRKANQNSMTVLESYEVLTKSRERQEFASPAIQIKRFGEEFLDAAIQLKLLERK